MNKLTNQSNSTQDTDRLRARILRDVDPAVVEAGRLSRLAFAERIGNPRRCDTRPSQVHPADGSCLYCGAWNGEQCRAARLVA